MNCYSYCIRSRYGKGWGRGIGPNPSHCHQCGAELPKPPHTGGTGYSCKDEKPAPALSTPMHDATIKLRKDEVITRAKAICYACCGENDKRAMIETGRAVLYLSHVSESKSPFGWRVTNWPGSLSFEATVSKGRHNIARSRYDAWFTGPDGKPWHCVNIGDNQILHCRRIKK